PHLLNQITSIYAAERGNSKPCRIALPQSIEKLLPKPFRKVSYRLTRQYSLLGWAVMALELLDDKKKLQSLKQFLHQFSAPGSDALTFGMLGCDYHCGYCQNWVTSQMLRDPDAVGQPKRCTPEQLVDIALKHGAPVVASSYNEPLITSEWAVDVFKVAKARGLKCAYISNGNGTPQVLDFIRPHVDAYKVDLKTFSDKNYRQLGGVLENVTATIRMLKERGFWVEIVTLVVPGFSDDPDDLKRMAEFLASVDPLMPWHMTAFHPDYKMTDGYRSTTAEDLMRIVEYGKQAGLQYMYPGNLPGQV